MNNDTSVRDQIALVATLADNKYFLGRRYAEWCTAAPALEAAVAAAAMAQDEIGHARSLYPLLRDLAGQSPETEPETRTQFAQTPFLTRSFESWTDFVAANFLFDTAMSVLLEGARESSLQGLAQRARRILEEERMHWLHGEGWTRRLAHGGSGVHVALEASFAPVLVESSRWFTIVTPNLVRDGTISEGEGVLRSHFKARIEPVLSEAGLRSEW